MAEEAGVSATTEMREGRYAVDVLLPESKRHDLLVLGTHGNTRASGLMFGSTASESAHQTERPLLIAREPPATAEFPKSILVATDGSPGSWAPVRTAAALAAAFGAELSIVHVTDGKYAEVKLVVEAQSVEIGETTGEQPTLEQPVGSATQGIVDAAKEAGATLIVCGRRGLSGIKALGSVSERVVHQADCSVLLVPAADA
jgi:nucleotide-binding universal stress UspA family protein